jgi:hypothetical protein
MPTTASDWSGMETSGEFSATILCTNNVTQEKRDSTQSLWGRANVGGTASQVLLNFEEEGVSGRSPVHKTSEMANEWVVSVIYSGANLSGYR